ncbi:MAG TPA: YdcF family protein, partial [Pyrinomonadaceae bacterium]|nr:YdcF family protein [Pyrinomonadaceae bacterium]
MMLARRRSRFLAALALALLLWPFLAWAAAKLLIVRAPLEHAGAIVLLSGSSSYKERAARSAELFAAGRAPRIILTNDGQQGSWNNVLERNPFYYESTLAELTRLGVPRDRVDILMQPVSSTRDEAVLLREHVEKNGIRSVLVVTSAYHSRRALWTFRRVLGESGTSIGLEVAGTGWQTPSPWTWWLRLRGWQTVPPEYFKL